VHCQAQRLVEGPHEESAAVELGGIAEAEPPPRVADLLDPVVSGPDTAAADADRMWLRALARIDS
jgi:hypothetical protein